jgi:hypothetical protein
VVTIAGAEDVKFVRVVSVAEATLDRDVVARTRDVMAVRGCVSAHVAKSARFQFLGVELQG